MLAAKVIPVGGASERREVPAEHDDHADGDAGDGPAPLPVLALLRAVPDEPDAEPRDEDADDQPRPDAQDPVEGGRLIVDRVLEGLERRPHRLQDADARRARPHREPRQHDPRAERALAQAVPGAAGASAPEDHANAEDEAARDVGEPAERPDRDGLDEPELEHVDAHDRDEEREHVGSQDRRVPHEDPVGERPREAEPAALRAVAEEESRQERAARRENGDLHGRDLSRAVGQRQDEVAGCLATRSHVTTARAKHGPAA